VVIGTRVMIGTGVVLAAAGAPIGGWLLGKFLTAAMVRFGMVVLLGIAVLGMLA
jgi:hypothetical protein